MKFETRKVTELQIHPLIESVYGSFQGTEDSLLESVRKSGILIPLLITLNNIVVAGADRLRVAKILKIESVSC